MQGNAWNNPVLIDGCDHINSDNNSGGGTRKPWVVAGNAFVISKNDNTSSNRGTPWVTSENGKLAYFAKELGGRLMFSGGSPTIRPGTFGDSAAIVHVNGTAAFTINIGNGGKASSGVLMMPAAPNGWDCKFTNLTTKSASVAQTLQSSTTPTSVTLGNYSAAMASSPWNPGDVISSQCTPY